MLDAHFREAYLPWTVYIVKWGQNPDHFCLWWRFHAIFFYFIKRGIIYMALKLVILWACNDIMFIPKACKPCKGKSRFLTPWQIRASFTNFSQVSSRHVLDVYIQCAGFQYFFIPATSSTDPRALDGSVVYALEIITNKSDPFSSSLTILTANWKIWKWFLTKWLIAYINNPISYNNNWETSNMRHQIHLSGSNCHPKTMLPRSVVAWIHGLYWRPGTIWSHPTCLENIRVAHDY